MERKEIILRNLIQIAKRYESEHTGLLAWEIPSVRDADKWLEELRKPDVSGRSEQLKAFADYAQKRMWQDGDKDLSEFVDEFLRL